MHPQVIVLCVVRIDNLDFKGTVACEFDTKQDPVGLLSFYKSLSVSPIYLITGNRLH